MCSRQAATGSARSTRQTRKSASQRRATAASGGTSGNTLAAHPGYAAEIASQLTALRTKRARASRHPVGVFTEGIARGVLEASPQQRVVAPYHLDQRRARGIGVGCKPADERRDLEWHAAARGVGDHQAFPGLKVQAHLDFEFGVVAES